MNTKLRGALEWIAFVAVVTMVWLWVPFSGA